MSMRPHDELEHGLMAEWLEAADTGLCAADDADRVVMMNKVACHLLGLDHASALNRPLRNIFRSVEEDVRLFDWLASGGSGSSGSAGSGPHEFRATQAGLAGRRDLLLKKRQVRHASGEMFKVIAVTDITELMEVQRLLEAQKRDSAQYRQWQALNAGVLISDALVPDMPIVYANPAFERMSGYSAGEALGRNCRFLQGRELEQPTLGPLRHAIRNGTNGYAVLRNYRKNGSLFINELFVSPVRDNKGRVIQFVGIQHLRTTDGNPGVM